MIKNKQRESDLEDRYSKFKTERREKWRK